ncbi:MAG: serine recombinase [Acidobacteria bacterium]|nr:serine recombinase [Acidobacteriota bacterium]
MNSQEKITAEHLQRRAIVYVRQSTVTQLQHNRESQLRQYGLAERARANGFAQVETIDDDLGRSGSGLEDRPGFQRLVGEVCSGQVGAVYCIEASRLARNGRDWHHLIELCGLVGALVVDPDGAYDPRLVNDRLLLGLKGTMNEFELNLLRQRSLEAMRQKAKRGELQCGLPVGYVWSQEGKILKDADRRVQQALETIFAKFEETGSVRQALLYFRGERISLPAIVYDQYGRRLEWKLPSYPTLHAVISNPAYAGAYAYGKTEARIRVEHGRAHKTIGHHKPRDQWTAFIKDHHEGYISWERYERNQSILAENNFMRGPESRKAGRGGQSLLTGLLRCGRCGRMLYTYYTGRKPGWCRYICRGAKITHGEDACISFSNTRPDLEVARAILRAVEPRAIEAAVGAASQIAERQNRRREALRLELEQVRYQAQLAARRYESVDPGNRLVADELEARWNVALRRVQEVEEQLGVIDASASLAPALDRERLLRLAHDLPQVWENCEEMSLKQRIARILIHEIVVDIDERANEVVMKIHWMGGRHTEVRIVKPKTGEHGHRTDKQAVEIVEQMAGRFPDETIAATLNRLGLKTGAGNTWRKDRVCTLRSKRGWPNFDRTKRETSGLLTALQAAAKLGIDHRTVRALIAEGAIPGEQVVRFAPWQIPAEALETPSVLDRVRKIKRREAVRAGNGKNRDTRTLPLPGFDWQE